MKDTIEYQNIHGNRNHKDSLFRKVFRKKKDLLALYNALNGTHYKNEDLDICASVFDGFAYGCKTALENAGYTEDNWPIITGQDADLKACKNIVAGKQTSSVYKDTRVLAEKCVTMVNAVCNGSDPEINDIEQYNNRVITVPAYLCTPIVINADNIKEIIVDGGYYTEEQLMD